MKKFPIILLAGGEKGPLFETTGYVEKALIPIHGKPMLSRVIETFQASERAAEIVVVGSPNLDDLPAMNHVRKRIFTGLNVVQNLLHAVTYVKHRLYAGAPDHNGYVISFCDAVFLTPEIVDDTLQSIEELDSDIILHYVEKNTFAEAGLPTKRTYIPVGDKHYTGSTIYYVKKFSKVFAAMPKLVSLRKHRKDPEALLRLIGCEGADLPEIEEAISRELSAAVRICVSPHARLGVDVDKPADLELADTVLKED
ncbi:MAG: NTP transferase domain-containing protein [Pirellulaceae bacterium]|jgi:GTP:adenosylcobinamide-phosphate guanylyltransferase|nr:NTP transferase domain-containing protein [Pirellulaceae bacterium]MDP7016986.1 NTP transferase domain-containing protein [Pirellulaceae bacterium]